MIAVIPPLCRPEKISAQALNLHIRFQHLSVENGLSDNDIVAITQDEAGFIWIATNDGLNRLDGTEVEVFRHHAGDVHSLSSNNLRVLCADSRGGIWAGTQNGLAYYDNIKHSFINYFKIEGNENSIPSNWITAIAESADGLIWIGTANGLCSFDVKQQRFRRYPQSGQNTVSSNAIHDIAIAPNGIMWVTTANGLNSFNEDSGTFTSYFHVAGTDSSLPANDLADIVFDAAGNIWTFASRSLLIECFSTQTHRTIQSISLKEHLLTVTDNNIRSIFIDSKNRLWVGTNTDGLKLYDPKRKFFITYYHNEFDDASPRVNNCVCFYQDRAGMLWEGSGIGGLECFSPNEENFYSYQSQPNMQQTLADKWVRAIAEDHQNNFWIGTMKGLSVLDRATGRYTNYSWKSADENTLSDNSVRSLCCDANGNMWVGTADGLNRFDATNHRCQRFISKKNDRGLTGNFIMSISAASNGDVWVGTNYGLCLYHAATKSFSNFKKDSKHQLLNSNIRVIFQDKHGTLWIGTYTEGILSYNPSNGELRQFLSEANEKQGLENIVVYSIAEDDEGFIWAGTQNGLCRVNVTSGEEQWLGEKDGLPNEHVAELLIDDHDRIWMSSNKGISVLNKERTAFINYDMSDGLQSLEFNDQSAFKTHDGYFCYCGFNGFNLFHPDSIRINSYRPQVVVHSFSIFDKPKNLDSILSKNHSLHLMYNENFFSFRMAALSYDHPEKNQYAYQLVGFDRKLNRTMNPVIRYTNVPPGNYTLKVIASNNNGIWNEEGVSFPLVINPPFWKTWWFFFVSLTAAAAALYGLFQIRINRLLAIQRIRTQISRDLHDEIGASLSSVNIMSSFAEQSLNGGSEEARHWINRIGDNTREMMEKIRDIVWTLNSSNETSGNILTRMKEFASQTLEPKEILFSFEEDERATELISDFIYKRNVYLIFKEAINNAAKYSACSSVQIFIGITEGKFKIMICDNGKGFDVNQTRSGNGLRNMMHRANQIRAKLFIESSNGNGTAITLIVPVPHSWYRFIGSRK